MKKDSISTAGLFFTFYISSMIGAFMFISTSGNKISSTDLILLPFSFTVAEVIFSIPVIVYAKKYKTTDIIGLFKEISPSLSKLAALLYAGIFILGSIRTVARFDLFASSVMFPEVDMSLFMVILVIVCAYTASLGLGCIGRSAAIFTAFMIITSVTILISLVPQIDMLNFTPLFTDGIGTLAENTISTTTFAVEISLIPYLLPKIVGKTVKSFYYWLLASFISITVFAFFLITTLGLYANTQMFPVFSLSSLGTIGLFERLDSIETAAWILGIVLKLTLFMYIASDALTKVFGKLSKTASLTLVTAVISLFSVYISQNIERFSIFTSSVQTGVSYAILVIILPIIALLLGKRITKREGRELRKSEV